MVIFACAWTLKISTNGLSEVCITQHHHSWEDVQHSFRTGQYFSTLDAKSGYWTKKLSESSQVLTAFNTPFKKYCFIRLPFGLSVSSKIFCEHMDRVLAGIPGTFPCADDVKVQGSTEERHDLPLLGPTPETIRSRSDQIRSCDPDRPIAFHKRRSRSAHQIEKIQNQTVYCQLNHDINHSLGNSELKLRGRDWIKTSDWWYLLMTSQWEVWRRHLWVPIREGHGQFSACTVFAHDTTRFGHAIFDRCVYVINVIENIQTVDTRRTIFQ